MSKKAGRLVSPLRLTYISPEPPPNPEKFIEMAGRIPIGVGKMTSLKILSLSNNLLRGSMPEGLISKLGATKVQKLIMPGNRLADVDTVSTVSPFAARLLFTTCYYYRGS